MAWDERDERDFAEALEASCILLTLPHLDPLLRQRLKTMWLMGVNDGIGRNRASQRPALQHNETVQVIADAGRRSPVQSRPDRGSTG